MNENPDSDEVSGKLSSSDGPQFAAPLQSDEYTDGRAKWDWKSKFPSEARREINIEASFLVIAFVLLIIFAGLVLGLANNSIRIPLNWLPLSQNSNIGDSTEAIEPLSLDVNFRLLAIFFSGSVGGITFSIKWLVHAVAKGSWHVDRRYWRTLIPFLGGIYACVILTFLDAGLLTSSRASVELRPMPLAAALAFLVGYFSDGVSGLLSNIANAVFGTLKK
jgi:hypothetical protein